MIEFSTPFLRVERTILSNGLRLVMQPDQRLPLAALELCVDAGSRDESPRLAGLAHLCEHLAFQGLTEESRALPARLQARGVTTNGTTFHGRTCFRDLLPKGEVPSGLWAAAHRLASRRLSADGEELARERRVLSAELGQQTDGRRLLALMQRLLYSADHPYHRSPAGEKEGLQRITKEDVEAFFEAHYQPERAVLVVTGDVSPSEVAERAEATLGELPGSGTDSKESGRGAPPELPPVDVRRSLASRAAAVSCTLASRAPGYGRRQWFAADLASHILNSRTGPLHRWLVDEDALAVSIRVSLLSLRQASTVILSAQGAPGVEASQLREALQDRAEKALREGVAETALRRARTAAVKSHYFRMQTLEYRASLAARLASYFDQPERLLDVAERYAAVQVEELEALGATLFQAGNRAVLTIGDHDDEAVSP